MKRQLSALLLSACSLVAWQTNAQTTPEHCYTLAHGEDGLGSTKFMHLPHLLTGTNKWSSLIYITNISDKNINVKLTTDLYTGVSYTPNNTDHYGFEPGNTPFNDWAILASGKSARLVISDDNVTDFLAGKLTWQADACIEHGLVASVRNVFSESGRYDQGYVLLNGGNPF